MRKLSSEVKGLLKATLLASSMVKSGIQLRGSF